MDEHDLLSASQPDTKKARYHDSAYFIIPSFRLPPAALLLSATVAETAAASAALLSPILAIV